MTNERHEKALEAAAVSEFFARTHEGELEGEVIIDLISKAIKNERENCANIAADTARASLSSFVAEGPGGLSRRIVFCIRRGYAPQLTNGE